MEFTFSTFSFFLGGGEVTGGGHAACILFFWNAVCTP